MNALLPIRRYENEIVRAVKENSVVVILGETGSGKTTQIAQIVYEHIDEILSTEQQQQKRDEDDDEKETANTKTKTKTMPRNEATKNKNDDEVENNGEEATADGKDDR